MSKSVYLASPIDQAGDKPKSYRFEAHAYLAVKGLTVYDPAWAWDTKDPSVRGIDRVNAAALDACDGLLALLPDGVPTIGVPIEITTMMTLGKPCVVYGGPAAKNSPALRMIDVPVFDNVEAAINVLADDLLDPVGGPVIDWQILPSPSGDPEDPTGGPKPEAQEDPPSGPQPYGTEAYLIAVRAEVRRAAGKFPDSDFNSVEDWFGIWAEEALEAFKAWNDHRRNGRMIVDGEPVERWRTAEDLRVELVQAAAMGARLWIALERGATGPGADKPPGPGGGPVRYVAGRGWLPIYGRSELRRSDLEPA